jgi:hypothetical protein
MLNSPLDFAVTLGSQSSVSASKTENEGVIVESTLVRPRNL